MSQRQWIAVDEYLTGALIDTDDALHAALTASDAAGLPAIVVSPAQGKLLNLLATLANARRILEIGTLAGYSTIWLARALPPDGRLITLESEPRHAEVARANIAKAGLADLVDVRVGAALDTLPSWRGSSTAAAPNPSIWCSSTRTRSTTPTTSPPRCASPGPEV
jgi:predicted O-methyltransferase YrrM